MYHSIRRMTVQQMDGMTYITTEYIRDGYVTERATKYPADEAEATAQALTWLKTLGPVSRFEDHPVMIGD